MTELQQRYGQEMSDQDFLPGARHGPTSDLLVQLPGLALLADKATPCCLLSQAYLLFPQGTEQGSNRLQDGGPRTFREIVCHSPHDVQLNKGRGLGGGFCLTKSPQ